MTSKDDGFSFYIRRRVERQRFSQLMVDEVALYSMTDQRSADEITAEIAKFVPSSGIVTDATASIGGNTFSFAQYFHKIQAFELCETRFQMLRHNLQVLGFFEENNDNVLTVQGDAAELCLRYAPQDIIFLDPPWGGPNYKKSEKVILFLSDLHLADFCHKIAPVTNFIAVKAPVNFDEDDFLSRTAGFLTLKKKNSNLRKMILYIFETMQ